VSRFALFLLLLPFASPASAEPVTGVEDSGQVLAADLASRVVRVVGIRAGGRGGLPAAGVLIGAGDLVLTTTQRAENGRRTTVLLPGEEERVGEVLIRDRETGVTLIRIRPPASIRGVEISDVAPCAGDPVLTAGFPFGAPGVELRAAVGLGIIAQVRRKAVGAEPTDFLITSAVNLGDVGGPLVDRNGRLIGILSHRGDPLTGLAAAIPVSRIRRVMKGSPEAEKALHPAPPGETAPDDAWPVHDTLQEAVAAVDPSVFSLLVTREVEGLPGRSVGTAFFVDSGGHALTVSENVKDAKTIRAVLPDGRELKVTKLGEDERRGVVLLVVAGENLPAPVKLSADLPPVGSFVAAVGRPGGQDWWNGSLVTLGIIGAQNRNDRRWGALHTDAAVNRGNAGGPLVDLDGNVVGLLSTLGGSTLTGLGVNSGLGFAIPARSIRELLPALLRGEFLVHRPGHLGVTLDNQAAPGGGVKVNAVNPIRPAAKAGIKVGDVIIETNGRPIRGMEDLRRIFTELREGEEAVIVVRRGEETLTLKATLGKWPAPPR